MGLIYYFTSCPAYHFLCAPSRWWSVWCGWPIEGSTMSAGVSLLTLFKKATTGRKFLQWMQFLLGCSSRHSQCLSIPLHLPLFPLRCWLLSGPQSESWPDLGKISPLHVNRSKRFFFSWWQTLEMTVKQCAPCDIFYMIVIYCIRSMPC